MEGAGTCEHRAAGPEAAAQAVQGGGSIVSASQLIGKVVTTQSGQSGQVTAVSSGANGLSFEVSGVGTVLPGDISQVSAS